jgi:hypothetical protein
MHARQALDPRHLATHLSYLSPASSLCLPSPARLSFQHQLLPSSKLLNLLISFLCLTLVRIWAYKGKHLFFFSPFFHPLFTLLEYNWQIEIVFFL